ncbi:hypothetical protein AAHB37_07035 [Glutamicibacter halophytocola]|uniref:hypothetical protein n=1 Tax=Glutamicibacter halophytocola TaxID=1933880 RepID=UPI0032197AB4
MPRSNRPRRSKNPRPGKARNHDEESEYEAGADDWPQRARFGVVRPQDAPDGQWHVRKIAPLNANKAYICPGCHQKIGVGVGHVVAWRADHWSGDDAAASARRHWHPHCWDTRSYRY